MNALLITSLIAGVGFVIIMLKNNFNKKLYKMELKQDDLNSTITRLGSTVTRLEAYISYIGDNLKNQEQSLQDLQGYTKTYARSASCTRTNLIPPP